MSGVRAVTLRYVSGELLGRVELEEDSTVGALKEKADE